MSEKHKDKSPIPCQSDSTKSHFPCEAESKSPIPCGGGLGVGIIPQGYKQTSIGIIPQDWELVRLGEVGDIVGGGTPDTTNPAFWNGEILWLTPTEIKQKYISTSERKITQKGLENSSAKILPKNTILITTRATIGDIGITTKELCTNQGFQSFVSGKNANFEFMYYLLCTKRSQFISLANGSTFLEVSAKTMRQIQIPLPPLKEQEKIARILGVWDSAIDSLANLIKAKRKYKTALMQRLLTPPKDKSTHPLAPSAREGEQENCPRAREGEQESGDFAMEGEVEKAPPLAGGVWGGVSVPNDREQEKYPRINKGECVELPRTNEGESHQSSLRFAGFSDKWQEFRLGDLLKYEQPTRYIVKNTEYSDSYQTPVLTAGKSFILGKTNETFGIYDDLPIILFDDFMATSQFVDFPFKVKSSASKILKAKNNSMNLRVVFEAMQMIDFCAENHKRYWISEYQNLKIKLPTLAEQKKIAQVLSACDKEIETLNLKFECLKAQKRGLMQQLLSGKVRVKC